MERSWKESQQTKKFVRDRKKIQVLQRKTARTADVMEQHQNNSSWETHKRSNRPGKQIQSNPINGRTDFY